MMIKLKAVKEIIIDEAQNTSNSETKSLLYNILDRIDAVALSDDINFLIRKLNDEELSNQQRISELAKQSLTTKS